MDSACSALNIFSKSVQILEAGTNVTIVVLDKERTRADIINAVAQTAFALVQIGDIYTRKCDVSIGVRRSMSYAAASTDVIRTITEIHAKLLKNKITVTESVCKVTGRVLFRIGDIAGAYVDESCSQDVKDCCKKITKCSEVASNVWGIGQSTYQLYFSIPAAYKAVKLYRERRNNQQQVRQERLHRILAPLGEIPIKKEAIPEIKPEEEIAWKKECNELLVAYLCCLKKDNDENDPNKKIHVKNFLKTIESIPSFMIATNDPRWQKCCITKKPIRFIVVPNFSDEQFDTRPELLRIKYERSEFEESIRANPQKCPQEWPADLWPFSDPLVISNRRAQGSIDDLLKHEIEVLCKLYGKLLNVETEDNDSTPSFALNNDIVLG